jgi:hypothetical protein
MKSIQTIALTLVALSLSAAELPIPEEQAALAAMAEGLFANPPKHATHRGEKTVEWSEGGPFVRITLDAEGKAVAFFANGLPMTNTRIAKLAALKNLRSISFDHSGQWHFKEIPMSDFSGSGWEALISANIPEVRIGGSHEESHPEPCPRHGRGHGGPEPASQTGKLHRGCPTQHDQRTFLV